MRFEYDRRSISWAAIVWLFLLAVVVNIAVTLVVSKIMEDREDNSWAKGNLCETFALIDTLREHFDLDARITGIWTRGKGGGSGGDSAAVDQGSKAMSRLSRLCQQEVMEIDLLNNDAEQIVQNTAPRAEESSSRNKVTFGI